MARLAASGSPDKAADLKIIDRDLRYLEARIGSAIVVPPGKGPEARFGARVTLQDPSGSEKTFQIVGEDEARTDPSALIPWSAPLAQSMLGAKPGDPVTWQGPDALVQYRITAVEYAQHPA